MKKVLLVLVLVFCTYFIYGQKISALSPTLVVWETGNKKYSLKDAKYGVQITDSLNLNVLFHKALFDRVENKNSLIFEYKWYYYMSTSRKLMFFDKVRYSNASFMPNNVVKITSGMRKLQPGWWEVQIVTTYDKGFLAIGGLNKFQIFVK